MTDYRTYIFGKDDFEFRPPASCPFCGHVYSFPPEHLGIAEVLDHLTAHHPEKAVEAIEQLNALHEKGKDDGDSA